LIEDATNTTPITPAMACLILLFRFILMVL